MSSKTVARSRKAVNLPFSTVRNISCPEDSDNNRKIYVGYTPCRAIIGLSTNENVRDYLVGAEGKQRKRPSQVHRAIQETLENDPDDFSVLNSGVVIVARDCHINEKGKVLELTNASIINGAQTQGVIHDYYQSLSSTESFPAHVKFEIIVTDDEDLIAEISIARNFQNDVMTISIAGRRGQLDELEKSFQKEIPGSKLQKSETKLSEDYVKTERLLQVITALIPRQLWPKGKEFNKVYAYSMKTKCLKEFQELYEQAKDRNHLNHNNAAQLYQFYLDIAAQAWQLYEEWKSHQGFQGTGLRSITREGGEIVEVPDGIIFPILASLSAFATKRNGAWTIDPPKLFTDDEIIGAAKSAYMNIAHSNPWNMGKSKACYAALEQITSIFKKLSR